MTNSRGRKLCLGMLALMVCSLFAPAGIYASDYTKCVSECPSKGVGLHCEDNDAQCQAIDKDFRTCYQKCKDTFLTKTPPKPLPKPQPSV
ncbi:MAG TPA: hypothetical protein VL688_06825 [Verrucomicrobiae bacterium]|jgi:hypothetical protein|nr:hypothetical protein [Verrucomicrobiae bacterium]